MGLIPASLFTGPTGSLTGTPLAVQLPLFRGPGDWF